MEQVKTLKKVIALMLAGEELTRKIAVLDQLILQGNEGLQLGLHCRELHARYFDAQDMQELIQNNRESLYALQEKLKQNRQQIAELMELIE